MILNIGGFTGRMSAHECIIMMSIELRQRLVTAAFIEF